MGVEQDAQDDTLGVPVPRASLMTSVKRDRIPEPCHAPPILNRNI